MIVKSTEIQNNFGKYLDLANEQEIVITRNGQPVARLVGMRGSVSFLADRLVGLISQDTDDRTSKDERLSHQ